MTSDVLFDPATLKRESEASTRARNSKIESMPVCSSPVFNDNYELDPKFDNRVPSGQRWDRFTDGYQDLSVDITLLDSGVLFGEGMLVCDAREPTLSSERLYLVPLERISNRLWRYTKMEVATGLVYLVGGNSGHRNHYHWMFQCLPSILLMRKAAIRQGFDYRIVLPPLHPRCRETLALTGVDANECITLDPDFYLRDVPLMYTNVASSRFTFQPSAHVVEALDGYRTVCLERGNPELPTHFYVSRRDAPEKRKLENEDVLVRALETRGYKELVMSDLSLEDQLSAFAHAESIVAPHGAGLVNVMFARSSARLVEIMPANYRYAYFFRLAQLRGMRYTEVVADVAESKTGKLQTEETLNVDVARVLSALDRSNTNRERENSRVA